METKKKLEKANRELLALNRQLQESNLIKEKYAVYFMNLYSEHVAYLESYRKAVANKIVAKRFEDLQQFTSSYSEAATKERELLTHFDAAFLNIYPNFVASLNKMLKQEAHFVVKNGVMNTELRIFALIRMGVNDSQKIASFLRCSVQTVHNYRSKIKRNCILDNTSEIEERIKNLQIFCPSSKNKEISLNYS